MTTISGGCLCGKVRYSTEAAPLMVAVCHCRNCQRQAGSAFSVIAGFPRGSVQMSGTLASYRDTGASGNAVIRKFCGDCGSPILSDVISMPQFDFIKGGTLDDPSWLKPPVHLWCDSAQPWVAIEDGVQKFAKNPTG